MIKLAAKTEAEQITDFLESELGQHLMWVMGEQYNRWHQQAESTELSPASKACLVDNAAGLKWFINYLQAKPVLLKEGYFKDEV